MPAITATPVRPYCRTRSEPSGRTAVEEGLPCAAAVIGLVVRCVLTMMAAVVAWGHGTGTVRRGETLPILIVAAIGSLLAVLEATDNVHLAGKALPGFGATPAEAGAFTAAII